MVNMETTTTTKTVDLVVHTTCGLEFEIIDADSGMSLTGRRFWCTDEDLEEDEELESEGWEKYRALIAKKGWTLRDEVWS
jgi:phosphate-selective porin